MKSQAGWLSLIFLGLLAFYNAVQHPFVHDDFVFILQNPHISQLDHWAEAFVVPAATGGLNTYYRPFLEIIYRLEYHLFGINPVGYHLVNIILHIINGLLLFGLLQQLQLAKRLAWLIALIFMIHPVQTEAVCCISGISNLWMALGVLLALHAYLRKWYIASLLSFVFAFLGKEQAIMFVPLVMVIDYRKGAKNFRWWLGVAAAGIVLLWLRQCMTGASLLHDIIFSPGELFLRLEAIPRDMGMYLQLIFFPYDLHYYRSTDILQSNSISWGLSLISLGVVFYIFHRWPQVRPVLILGLGWFLAALLPVLNFVPLINEYSFILTPEHFLYLPIVGILILVMVGGDHCIKHHRKFLLGIILGSCFLLTWYQNSFWNSEIVLFERMLRFEPNFGRGHLLLAKAYYFNGHPDLAEEHFQKAFKIMAAYAKKASNVTARNFYLRYLEEISSEKSRNEKAMLHVGLNV